jgi:hypothetical protein
VRRCSFRFLRGCKRYSGGWCRCLATARRPLG